MKIFRFLIGPLTNAIFFTFLICWGYKKGYEQGFNKSESNWQSFFNTHTFRPRLSKVSVKLDGVERTRQVDFYENKIRVQAKDYPEYGEDISIYDGVKMVYSGGVWVSKSEAENIVEHTRS
jgi:hypothetical protein